MEKTEEISLREFARRMAEFNNGKELRLSSVQEAIRVGRIFKTARGKILWPEAREDFLATRRAGINRSPVTSPGQEVIVFDRETSKDQSAKDYMKFRAIREEYEAKLKQLQYEREQRVLIPKDHIEKQLDAILDAFVAALDSIPDRYSAQFAAETDEFITRQNFTDLKDRVRTDIIERLENCKCSL